MQHCGCDDIKDHVRTSLTVSPGGTVTFRYDYYLNGCRETLTVKHYGPGGISLAMARCAKA